MTYTRLKLFIILFLFAEAGFICFILFIFLLAFVSFVIYAPYFVVET